MTSSPAPFRLSVLVLVAAGCLAQVPPPLQSPAPRKKSAAAPLSKPAAAPPPSWKDLVYPPLHAVAVPNVETITLPNGMRLYLLEDHELPLIHGTARIRTGNLFDPAEKIGLATLTGMVLRTGGTRTRTGEQLDEELENIAASVESNIDESFGSVGFSCLKENSNEVVADFHDVLTQPEFRQDKLDLARTGMSGDIARRNDEPRGIAEREFANTVYGRSTPYGWQEEYDTINRVTRSDLAAFYRRYFFPANTHAGGLGRFQRAGNEGPHGKAVRRLDRGTAARARLSAGRRQTSRGHIPGDQVRCDADFFLDRTIGRRAQGQGLPRSRNHGRHSGRRISEPPVPQGSHRDGERLRD